MFESTSSAALVERHLLRMAEGMCAEMIMTPADRLTVAEVEEPVAAVAGRLTGFDQAPVVSGGRAVGLLRPNAAGAGQFAGEAMTPLTDRDRVRVDTPIADVIARLTTAECLLVFGPGERLAGLLHFADLNKHAVRTYCYLWLAALELALAQRVRCACPGVETWIGHLDEKSQVQILGRYEYQRRKSVHVDHVEGVELTDLLRIVERTESIRVKMGYPSASAFQKVASPLASLRHDAMHPVRSLIRGHADVGRLEQRLANLRTLVASAQGGV